MPQSDISITTDAFVQFGGTIFAQNVLAWGFQQDGIQVRTNVNAPQTLTKLSATGKPRPYRATDDKDGQGAKYTDRILTAHQSKWDWPFDFEDFRNTYLADPAFKDKMLYEGALSFISDKFREYITTTTAYLGVRDGAGDAPEDICDGWGTIIAAEITAGNLVPVVTGAITSLNAEAKVKLVVRAVPKWMRAKGGFVYCSYDIFDAYADNYAANHGFQYLPNATGDYRIDNTKFILRPVAWMGTSSRLIATIANNLVMGTDVDRISVYPTPQYNIINTRLMMPCGFEIQDLEAVYVNDQA